MMMATLTTRFSKAGMRERRKGISWNWKHTKEEKITKKEKTNKNKLESTKRFRFGKGAMFT